jgi:hypothetical protein
MTRSVIKPKEPEFVFHFTFFTTRTNFKPKQTQTNSFILVLSEAVTTRDNLHVRFGSHFCFKRSSHANRNNRKDKRSTKDNSPCLVCVCVAWKRESCERCFPFCWVTHDVSTEFVEGFSRSLCFRV